MKIKKIVVGLVIGLAVGTAYFLVTWSNDTGKGSGVTELPRELIDVKKGEEKITDVDNDKNKPVNKEEKKGEPGISDNVEVATKKQQRTSITDKPVGRIKSEVIRMDEPVYIGASELNMMRGVATVEAGEQLNEKTVAIAGHRAYTPYTMFNGVLRLVPGNEVTVEMTDGEGKPKSTVYVVKESFNVPPTQIEVLEDDKNQKKRKLVLVTCDIYNPETKLYDMRRIVTAYEK